MTGTGSPAGRRLRVGIACNPSIRPAYLDRADLDALGEFADVALGDFTCAASTSERPPPDPAAEAALGEFAAGLDALVVCHGAPRVTAEVLAAAPSLRLLGELEGDRFAGRIDVEAAAARGVDVVDTTHGSSYPVAEWALALMILGLRGGGRWFRDVIGGDRPGKRVEDTHELTGCRVGLIGFGHIAWRLVEMLRPFRAEVLACDPYAAPELADALDVTLAPLDVVLSRTDVVVCLAPLTPGTRGMLGRAELDLIPPGGVFVNVSRGAVTDTAALVERLRRGDIVACLDVFDPEPLSPETELARLPNVFCSPHIAGVTAEARPRFFTLMVEELRRFATGARPRALITERTVAGRRGTPPPGRADPRADLAEASPPGSTLLPDEGAT